MGLEETFIEERVMFEVLTVEDMSFEEAYTRLYKKSPRVSVSSGMCDDGKEWFHEVRFIDPEGSTCLVYGSDLRKVVIGSLLRYEVMEGVVIEA